MRDRAESLAQRIVERGTIYCRVVAQQVFMGVRLGRAKVERDPWGLWLIWPNGHHDLYPRKIARLNPFGRASTAFGEIEEVARDAD